MMKIRQYIYGIALLIGATACQQEAIDEENGKGILLIGSLQTQAANEVSLATKAVDSDLIVTIDPGKLYHQGELGATIELEEGDYTVKAFNEAHGENRTNEPCYYAEQTVTIKKGEINRIDMKVPMSNCAITLSGNFSTFLSSYKLEATQGETTTEIGEAETKYFATKEPISYVLTAIDLNGVTRKTDPKTLTPSSGTIYTLYYTMGTKSIEWNLAEKK